MKVPILLPNIFNNPFTYESDINLKIEFQNYFKRRVMILKDTHIFTQDVTKMNF